METKRSNNNANIQEAPKAIYIPQLLSNFPIVNITVFSTIEFHFNMY